MASLSLTTYGSAFTVVANRCPTCGQARVYLDSKLRATIDTRAATTLARQVVWTLRLGPIGRHTVKVTVLGTARLPRGTHRWPNRRAIVTRYPNRAGPGSLHGVDRQCCAG